ncbi:5'-3' exoribonuclease 2 homolog [Anopheles cruzii]|uniref:5'-3' exoribonuclease 2 homolog n=1 Tax=Anopheles cruzii TaxID=68878 RepID=UPI0022EC20C8|nr:5'-3' exoribonuclease 2 homolog [Anopheles cruzii]
MGVPAFFRWLSRKYPSVIIECVEQKNTDDHGNVQYEDMSKPNPNRVEFDNLYLDMNGIIHPCTHPEDKPAPKNEDEMMVAIFECIDRLMNIVRPRKVLYMAIDGVAPRAKMNQQRSRRFRASKEAAEKAAEMARVREELAAKGAILPPEKEKGSHFDSNCITPGTPFMDRLSKCLQYYVHDRMNNYPGWKGLKVILSDANVPGEGEHKIMDYIRKQRVQADYDPNTHHVLCGADADLIMLGLATHETHFTIIREEFLPNKDRPCDICQQIGHVMKDCTGLQSEREMMKTPPGPGKETQFIFVRLNVLKEYLQKELDMPNLPFAYDFERVIDDWVFMCFFVGNDFLPHLPSLEIRENAIDRLVTLYKKCVYKTRGYLTDSGAVLLDRVEMIMTDLGYAEDEIFRQRKVGEDRFKERNKRMRLQKERQQRPNFQHMNNSQFAPTPLGRGVQPQAIVNARQEAAHLRGTKRKADEPLAVTVADAEEQETPDEVRLWEDGFKDRYYESKFDVSPQNTKFRQTVAWEYVRGLCWVLRYYYQGCASWEWYFPYHYAPFASDFKHLENVNAHFDRGTPFKPLQQLMGVFPAASRSHVPSAFAELMVDPRSPIIDFYPIDFHIDLNGKKFAWQGVALLPFVDEKRLFRATDPKVPLLTEEEKLRNINGDAKLFVVPGSPGYRTLAGLCVGDDVDYEREIAVTVDCVQGLIVPTKENVPQSGALQSPIPGLTAITDNRVLTVRFLDPKFADDFIFPARKLDNATDQPKVLGAKEGPVIGFGPRVDRAQLGAAGHRMVNNRLGLGYGNSRNDSGGSYGNDNDGGRRNNYPSHRRGNSGGYDNSGSGNRYESNRNDSYNNYSSYNTGSNSSGSSSNNWRNKQDRQPNNSTNANQPFNDAAGSQNRSVFEQLSSQIQQYQQQMVREISRHSQAIPSTALPNPFANQVQYNYDTGNSNSANNWMANNGGRNNNNHRGGGRGGGGGGGNGGGRQFQQGGGRYGGGNRYNQRKQY